MSYIPDAKRYDGAMFEKCGRSGIVCPEFRLDCGRISEASTFSRRVEQWSGAHSIEA
jgi:hypothetical protein